VVWIRFPRLPYQYYHRDVLDGLGNLIGRIVRPDLRTQNSVPGKFARIAVEVDLLKPLPKGVFVDGVWQVVEYENLPSFCRGYGCFGHSLDVCACQSEYASLAVDTVINRCIPITRVVGRGLIMDLIPFSYTPPQTKANHGFEVCTSPPYHVLELTVNIGDCGDSNSRPFGQTRL
ncbi:hypothetical protein LINGRAHAP2_LOCUS28924, partial [Linum grandiflorum]